VIYAQLDELQDSTSNVMTWEEWRNMGETMGGVAVMGGPATDLLDGVHAPITPSPSTAGMEHGAMSDGRDSAPTSPMMDLHMRMMADTAIRRRVMADTAMHRLMKQLMAGMPARHREHMRRMMGHDAKPQARPRAPAPPLLRPEANDSAPHRGHEMPD
jgi:hypothetical protein